MKKWFIIAGAFVVVVIAVVFFAVSNIGPIIKTAVNTYGPGITRTDVRVGGVGVSLFAGEAKLTDFFLGNPKGFTSPEAMKVGSIYMQVDKRSLTSNPIVIDKIEIVRPDLTYEKGAGTDNFQTILHNVQSAVGSETSGKKSAEGGGKKLLIHDLIIKDGKVNLAMTALAGRTVSADLPEIHLKDLGSSKGGASPAEVVHEVFAALHEKITGPAVTEALNAGLKNVGLTAEALGKEASQISGGATKAAESMGGQAAGKVKGLFGR